MTLARRLLVIVGAQPSPKGQGTMRSIHPSAILSRATAVAACASALILTSCPGDATEPTGVKRFDGNYSGTAAGTFDDGSTFTRGITVTVADGAVTLNVDNGKLASGVVAESGVITFTIDADATTKCSPTAISGQITLTASGVEMTGNGSQPNRGYSQATASCIPGSTTFTFIATRTG